MLTAVAVNETRQQFTEQVYAKLLNRSGGQKLDIDSEQALHKWWRDPRLASRCLELSNDGLGYAHPIMPSWVFNLNADLPYTLDLQLHLSRLTCPYYPVYPGGRSGRAGLSGLILFGEQESTWLTLYGIDSLKSYLRSL